MATWAEIYSRETRDLRTALEAGPIVLSGVPGSGRACLVTETVQERPYLEIRPTAAGTAADLRQDTVRAVLRFLAEQGAGSSDHVDYEGRVANAFGIRSGEAIALADGGSDVDLSFGDIVDAIPSQACVVVQDSHKLAEDWAEGALWALRRRGQRGYSPWLVLLTRPWHLSSVAGPKGPFFGFGRTIHLSAPELADWIAACRNLVPSEEVAWLVEQTRGLPRPTFAALNRLEAGDVDVTSAWTGHVREARDSAIWAQRLAGALHPYGPRLLGAIALNRPVYPAVSNARTDAVAGALRAMRDHDLIFQPSPRRWVVADPALVPHLAARSSDVARARREPC